MPPDNEVRAQLALVMTLLSCFVHKMSVYKKGKLLISQEPTEFPSCVCGGNCKRQFNSLRFSETQEQCTQTFCSILTEKKGKEKMVNENSVLKL